MVGSVYKMVHLLYIDSVCKKRHDGKRLYEFHRIDNIAGPNRCYYIVLLRTKMKT